MPAEPNVKSGALLGFKVGLQSAVDTMLAAGANAGAEHGCFYLTKDAHRLYVGNEDGSLSAVNEGIEWIDEWSDLQNIAATASSSVSGAKYLTGRFYYVQDNNVLCVYNGQNWVQLNENTNTTISSNAFSVTTASGTSTITSTITDSLSAEYEDSFTVTGANGVSITSSGKAITITGDTYTLNSNQALNSSDVTINLNSSGTNNDSTVTLIAGDNVTLANDNNDNEITITSQDTTVASVEVSAESQGFEFTVTDSYNASQSDTFDPTVAVYTSSSPSGTTTNSVHFINGTATLDVYSRGAIDSKLQAVNAMTYRGTVGATGSGATSITESNGSTNIVKNGSPVSVSIGDTFLMLDGGTYNNQTYKANSLFIVRAKDGASEGSDGYIAASDFICDIVSEEWNSDTTFVLSGITGGIQLHSSTGADVGSLTITAGSNNNWIQITDSGDAGSVSGSYDKTLTITHKDITRTNTTGTAVTQGPVDSVTIPVVTAVTSDAKGHITGVTTTSYTLSDTNAELDSMSTVTSAYTDTTNGYQAGVINTTTVLAKSNGSTDTETASVVISSSSLAITDEDSRPTALNGSVRPGGLKIEMLWGSF